MIYWYWRYIPCKDVKLDFESLDLYSESDSVVLHLRRKDPKQRIKVKRKHIRDDDEGCFKRIDGVGFELILRSPGGDGTFRFDLAHVFSFLLMIKTGGWINAPAALTSSLLEDPDADVFCIPFIDTTPTHYRDVTLTMEEAVWIKRNMEVGLRLTNKPIFQNAMQALTSFHCLPYSNSALLLAWSGLEALFNVSAEISFQLSLYIANFLKEGSERATMFQRLRKSYNVRSKVTHGAGAKIENLRDYANETRDILCACLQKCVETGEFPDARKLVFGD